MTRARFWLFAGEFTSEPLGGMRDYREAFDSSAEAIAWGKGYMARCSGGWACVWDSAEDKEVWNDGHA